MTRSCLVMSSSLAGCKLVRLFLVQVRGVEACIVCAAPPTRWLLFAWLRFASATTVVSCAWFQLSTLTMISLPASGCGGV